MSVLSGAVGARLLMDFAEQLETEPPGMQAIGKELCQAATANRTAFGVLPSKHVNRGSYVWDWP